MTKLAISQSIRFGILGLTSMLCLNSCKKQPFVRVPKSVIEKNIIEKLDSFEKESLKILDDTSYVCYGIDTLKFNKEFDYKLQKQAIKQNPKVKVSTKVEHNIVPVEGIGISMGGHMSLVTTTKPIYEYKFNNVVGIISAKEIYTTNFKNSYVPVAYYGKPNPKSIQENK